MTLAPSEITPTAVTTIDFVEPYDDDDNQNVVRKDHNDDAKPVMRVQPQDSDEAKPWRLCRNSTKTVQTNHCACAELRR